LQLHTLIPAGKNPDEFIRNLGRRFKNVCFGDEVHMATRLELLRIVIIYF